MSKTIARLLKKLKIKHNIPLNSPLLALPLSLFQKEEYSDLISILWLYGEQFIDRSKTLKPSVVMGDVSRAHVSELYQSVKEEVSMALALLSTDEDQLGPWSIKTKPNGWVNATQVTHFLRNSPTHNILMGCYHMVNILTQWIETDDFDTLAFLNEFEIQQRQNIHKTIITHLISALPYIGLFKDHPNPQHLIFNCIINLNKKIEQTDNNSDEFKILDYFYEVLLSLAREYPPTIQIFLFSLGINIPDNLDPYLERILRHNLHEVDSFTDQEWPELIYYVSLFMVQYAKTDSSMQEFTYMNPEQLSQLHILAQRHGDQFSQYLDAPADTEINIEQYSDEEFRHTLREELDNNQLGVLHPMVLGLLCFENCKPLKELFKMAYKQQNAFLISDNTIAIRPSTNPFLLGKALSIGEPLQYLRVSNHDLAHLERLIAIAKKINENSIKEKPASQELESDTAINSAAEELHLIREQYNARRNGGHYFFPPPANDITHSDFILQMDDDCIEFHDVRSRIKNRQLRNSIDSANTMSHYEFIPVINYSAITQFIMDYGVNSTRCILPTYLQLKDFFEAVPGKDTLDLIVTKIASQFIDLDAVETLYSQIDNLNINIEYFKHFLSAKEKNPDNKELTLRRQWLETQVSACEGFKDMIENRIQEIEEAKEEEREGMFMP